MPMPYANGSPSWDGRESTLADFLWRLNHHLKASEITGDLEKLEWLVNYVSPEVRMDWIQWPEYRTPDWDGFIAKLEKEYPKMHDDRLWGVQALRDLCSEYNGLSLHDVDEFNIFKRKFMTIAERCMKDPAL
ncbi:hypothetical protein P691DRAFT_630802, partial [Macrolepiota fuliginosa MF-IS2]